MERILVLIGISSFSPRYGNANANPGATRDRLPGGVSFCTLEDSQVRTSSPGGYGTRSNGTPLFQLCEAQVLSLPLRRAQYHN